MNEPSGFEEYWAQLRADVARVETDWERTSRRKLVVSRGKSWLIDWVRYSSINDQVIHGWLATPYDHSLNGAGFLWLPGYSYGTPPPDDSNLVAGTVTLAINVHGNAADTPYINPAGKDDYILQGIDNPSSYIYRSIVGHCLYAIDVLEAQPEVTRGIGAAGMSQGGGLALLVASQDPRAKICCADMPFLSDIRTALVVSHSPAYRTLKRHTELVPTDLSTILLFDPLFHAHNITVPTWLSAGGKDPACKPITVEAVFNALASEIKEYELFPLAGHVFTPEMNAAYQRLVERYIVG
jgi:cephalosporin-C deacetylase